MEEILTKMINEIMNKKGSQSVVELKTAQTLRNDYGFDSLDLAELTVRIEDEFGVDIFEHGNVDTISEILKDTIANE